PVNRASTDAIDAARVEDSHKEEQRGGPGRITQEIDNVGVPAGLEHLKHFGEGPEHHRYGPRASVRTWPRRPPQGRDATEKRQHRPCQETEERHVPHVGERFLEKGMLWRVEG